MVVGTHRNNFDALRLVGALAVLSSHQLTLSGRSVQLIAGYSPGSLGVMMFFAISGYLVSASWQSDPSLGRFLVRRSLRIAPAFFALKLLTSICIAGTGLNSFGSNPIHVINGSLWSIPLEVQSYLLYALIALFIPRAAFLMAALLLATGISGPLSWLADIAIYFAAGAALREYPLLRTWRMTLAILACGGTCLELGLNKPGLILIMPTLTVLIGLRCWPLVRDAGRFGDFSYGIYLYAFPIQQIVIWHSPAAPFYQQLLMSAIPTFMMAVLSWRLIETPALTLKKCLKPVSTSPPQKPAACAWARQRAADKADEKPATSETLPTNPAAAPGQ